MMISLDSETTGKDVHHGSRPFFVTTAFPDGTQQSWRWDVDPETRKVMIPESEKDDIRQLLADVDEIVGQNIKFDASALASIGITPFPWEKVHDTLFAAHLLASNRPKDLTTLAMVYLGRNIQPLEDELEKAVKECRQYCKKNLTSWMIAKPGLVGMPSAKTTSGKDKESKIWKSDCWLPYTVADYLEDDFPDDHPYRHVLANYANEDSAVTFAIWIAMRDELHRRGLWEIYEERRKLLPVVHEMETRGVTLSPKRLEELYARFTENAEESSNVCNNIARSMNFELVLPKGSAVNKSLKMFCFDVMGLQPVRNPKSKTDEPSLDKKNAIPYYLDTLPPRSRELRFIETLETKRDYETALGYMDQYRRYWSENTSSKYNTLHPSINPVGTDTLRFSFSNPNSANISKREGFNTRYTFGPADGREWWAFDAQNIELRLPAYEAEERELIDLFERADEPPYYGSEHLLNFSTVYPDIWEDAVSKVGIDKAGPWCKKTYASTYYQWCKNGDFAVGYGAVDRSDGTGTADRTFRRPGSHARLKARFASKERLNQKWIQFANKHGYVETIPDRTVNPKRGYPLLCSRSEWGDILPTVPLNFHIQGSAMWWTSKAMVRVHAFFARLNSGELFQGRKWLGGYYIALQVHDELDLDMPSGKNKVKPGQPSWKYNLPIVKEVKRLMEMGGEDFGIPTPVGCEFHEHNWSEGISLTHELRECRHPSQQPATLVV